MLENSFIHINTKPSFVKLTHASLSLSLFCALSGQFTEDGSFIGQYVPGKLQPPVSPQPLNNTASAHQQQSPSQPAAGVAAGAGSNSGGGSGGSAAGAGGGASSAANTAAVATYV